MSYYFDQVWSFKTARFSFDLSLGPEIDSPDWDFESEDERAELFEKINDGRLLYFCARWRVKLDGATIAENYLGQCCYESAADFMKDGYHRDMLAETIREARQSLAKRPRLRAA